MDEITLIEYLTEPLTTLIQLPGYSNEAMAAAIKLSKFTTTQLEELNAMEDDI